MNALVMYNVLQSVTALKATAQAQLCFVIPESPRGVEYVRVVVGLAEGEERQRRRPRRSPEPLADVRPVVEVHHELRVPFELRRQLWGHTYI